jgi:DNA-binding protein HU-beta
VRRKWRIIYPFQANHTHGYGALVLAEGALVVISPHMNKAEIVVKVHDVLGTSKADAERAVETVIDCIVSSLKKGQEVSIAGLGIFSAKMRPARTGRNPRTGESIEVPAMRVPKFRAAKALKDAVK